MFFDVLSLLFIFGNVFDVVIEVGLFYNIYKYYLFNITWYDFYVF